MSMRNEHTSDATTAQAVVSAPAQEEIDHDLLFTISKKIATCCFTFTFTKCFFHEVEILSSNFHVHQAPCSPACRTSNRLPTAGSRQTPPGQPFLN